MNIEELRKLNTEDLNKELAHQRELLRSMRFQAASNQMNQFHKIEEARRTIARILTLLNNA